MEYMYSGIGKGISQVEVTLNSEKFKPVISAIVELHKSEGIRHRQLKFCSNFLKAFWVNLKT